MAGFATLQGFWLVAAGSVMVGIGGGLLSPIFLVFFTERVAERVRGRVLSLVNALGMVAAPIGLSADGPAADPDLAGGRRPCGVHRLRRASSAYALVSRGMREFAATAPAPPEPDLSRHCGGLVLTISQLAAYAGVSVRTVRWYHQRGLLPEPARDASGYRRYDGQAVIDLVRISTLAGAGVPLARVGELLAGRRGGVQGGGHRARRRAGHPDRRAAAAPGRPGPAALGRAALRSRQGRRAARPGTLDRGQRADHRHGAGRLDPAGRDLPGDAGRGLRLEGADYQRPGVPEAPGGDGPGLRLGSRRPAVA